MLGEILVSPSHFYSKHFHLFPIFLGYLTTHITLLISEKISYKDSGVFRPGSFSTRY